MPRPIRAKYTIPAGAQFGAPRAGGRRIHQGCDYHCPIGTPIYGTGDGGKVTYIGYNPDPNSGSGNNIVIAYPGGRITTDMHLRERTPLHVGSPVNTQTIVGYVGITGNAINASPPGSHDHHQMTVNGKLINPEGFYGSQPAGTGTPITEENIMPKAVVVQRQGSKHFGWIAVVSESGFLHEIEPGPNGQTKWWENYAACYTPTLEAEVVEDLEYETFLSANRPQSAGGVASIDYAALAKAVNDDAAKRLGA